jgi:hypothetical protein
MQYPLSFEHKSVHVFEVKIGARLQVTAEKSLVIVTFLEWATVSMKKFTACYLLFGLFIVSNNFINRLSAAVRISKIQRSSWSAQSFKLKDSYNFYLYEEILELPVYQLLIFFIGRCKLVVQLFKLVLSICSLGE